jgi:hypothetical protein
VGANYPLSFLVVGLIVSGLANRAGSKAEKRHCSDLNSLLYYWTMLLFASQFGRQLMGKFPLLISLLALTDLAMISTAGAACQGGYPMICKAPLMESFSYDNNIFRIALNRSSVAGDPDFTKIPQGSCAWLDRPINSSEPTFLTAIEAEGQNNNSQQLAQYSSMAASISSAVLAPDAVLYFSRVCNDDPHAPGQFLSTGSVTIVPPGVKNLPPNYYYANQ